MIRYHSGAVTVLGITVAAVLLDLSTFHGLHHADSLVPVLISLHKWTFYYWEQNRYGMLTALLASPFDHPLTNLLVQNGITIWAGMACFPLAARYFGAGRLSGAIGLVALSLFVTLAPAQFQWLFFSTFNVFAVSMALGFCGLLIAENNHWSWTRRVMIGAACFLIGSWVNSAMGLMFLPLATLIPFTRWFSGDDPESLLPRETSVKQIASHPLVAKIVYGVGLCGVGSVCAMFLQRTTPYRTTWIVRPPVSEWQALLELAVTDYWNELHPVTWAASGAVMFAMAMALLLMKRYRTANRQGLFTLCAILISSLLYCAAMCVLFQGRWRYAVPSFVMIHVGVCFCLLRPLLASVSARGANRLQTLGMVFTLLAVPTVWGPPSASVVKNRLKTSHSDGLNELIAARCTHVAGDYWKVWPAMYMVNWHYTDNSEPNRIWALSHRSEPTKQYWGHVPTDNIRVGCFVGDPKAAEYRNMLGVKLKHVETQGEIEVWVSGK